MTTYGWHDDMLTPDEHGWSFPDDCENTYDWAPAARHDATAGSGAFALMAAGLVEAGWTLVTVLDDGSEVWQSEDGEDTILSSDEYFDSFTV